MFHRWQRPSKKTKFKIYRQSESLFEHFSRLGTSQSASCSFCVVLEGFPTQKRWLLGRSPRPPWGSFQRSPIPPSWAGGVPPSRTLPGMAPPIVSPSPFQPPSRLDPLVGKGSILLHGHHFTLCLRLVYHLYIPLGS